MAPKQTRSEIKKQVITVLNTVIKKHKKLLKQQKKVFTAHDFKYKYVSMIQDEFEAFDEALEKRVRRAMKDEGKWPAWVKEACEDNSKRKEPVQLFTNATSEIYTNLENEFQAQAEVAGDAEDAMYQTENTITILKKMRDDKEIRNTLIDHCKKKGYVNITHSFIEKYADAMKC